MNGIILLISFFCGLFLGNTSWAAEYVPVPAVTQTLVAPPFLPDHQQVDHSPPKNIQVRMTVVEKEMTIAPGVKIHAPSYNGTVPGPVIVAHQDDYVQLTLVNPASNTMIHNIDFHGATGALGGAEITKVAPGQEVTLRFKAIKTGVFIYHCAPGGLMIPFHVTMGMSGVLMVLPRDGLKDHKGNPIHYDRAYYIGEQSYYLPKDANGKYKHYDSILASLDDVLAETRKLTPSFVVFNGSVGALTGNNALTAKVGEKVLFIHSQANEDSRPHLIGGHGDLVWVGGSFDDQPISNQETWFVPGGSAVAALYTFKQPGIYTYLNHNLIQAVQLGALAQVKVDGGVWDNDLMEATPPVSH
ncbi:MAG: copper-containing nitrite reductase [Methylococcales bacterium]|nr:copper-containing nitrite reductase [Methylococcales bacterium]